MKTEAGDAGGATVQRERLRADRKGPSCARARSMSAAWGYHAFNLDFVRPEPSVCSAKTSACSRNRARAARRRPRAAGTERVQPGDVRVQREPSACSAKTSACSRNRARAGRRCPRAAETGHVQRDTVRNFPAPGACTGNRARAPGTERVQCESIENFPAPSTCSGTRREFCGTVPVQREPSACSAKVRGFFRHRPHFPRRAVDRVPHLPSPGSVPIVYSCFEGFPGSIC